MFTKSHIQKEVAVLVTNSAQGICTATSHTTLLVPIVVFVEGEIEF